MLPHEAYVGIMYYFISTVRLLLNASLIKSRSVIVIQRRLEFEEKAQELV